MSISLNSYIYMLFILFTKFRISIRQPAWAPSNGKATVQKFSKHFHACLRNA